jgi:hypothetical protein
MSKNFSNIPIYNLDTIETVKSRIASRLNSISKYIYLPDDFTLEEQKITDNDVVDVLNRIKKHAQESTDFSDFLDQNVNYLDKLEKLDVKKDILNVWLAYNTELEKLANLNTLILTTQAQQLQNYYGEEKQFLNFWNTERQSVKQKINLAITEEKIKNEKYTKICKDFESITDENLSTEIKPLRISTKLTLNIKNVTLLELFNHIILNTHTPFAVCGGYYKILKNFIPSEEWPIVANDQIIIKVNQKLISDTKKFTDYTDVKFSIVEGVVYVDINLTQDKKNVSENEFIERCLAIFNGLGPVSYVFKTETELNGVFYFPETRINTYVFSDLVAIDSTFSSLISIDESTKATKKKKDLKQPILYIHFSHINSGDIKATLTQKLADKRDLEIRDEDLIEHGSPYVKIKFTSKNKKSGEFFQNLLAKLAVLYIEKYNDIAEIYEQYIPDFGVVYEEKVKPLNKTELAPELFVSNYSRFCSEERFPTVFSDEELKKEYEEKGKQVMIFPRDKPSEGELYPSDGQNQQYYACDNPEYPYVGLQENKKLSNSKDYPFIPCCFKIDQTEKPGNYRKYYFGEELKAKKDKKQQDLIITDKILSIDKYGILPEELDKLFQILDTDIKYKYIRVGVSRTKSSFLNAVLLGLYEKTKLTDIDEEKERIRKVFDERKEIAEKAVLAKQCCYDLTTEQIVEKIANLEDYFDPNYFLQFLEEVYDVNIFLFNREKIITPRFIESYYRKYRDRESIFIYEHNGSESDNAQYPQCELIVKWFIGTKNTDYFFDYKSSISSSINKIFKLVNESYVLNKKIVEVKLQFPEYITPVSQIIDSYGKTRVIFIKHQNKKYSILTTPIPPLDLKETPDEKLIYLSFEDAVGLFDLLKTGDDYIEGDKALQSVLGNVEISIPLTGYDENKKSSSLKTFNKNKQIARYLFEYVLWIFSKYLKNQNITEVNEAVFVDFSKRILQTVENYQYEIVPKIFNENNSICKNGKIIVSSLEMKKRLLYMLRLYCVRDFLKLKEYYKFETINNYYLYLSDFDTHQEQVILKGEDSVFQWIEESKISLTLYEKPIVGRSSPYFFRNNLVENGKVFLARNTDSLKKAFNIATFWFKNGFNKLEIEEPHDTFYRFKLYSFVSEDNIKKFDVKGKKFKEQIIILGYKLQNISYFTVLLKL